MTRPDIAIIRTGSANLASVQAAFARLGVRPILTDDPTVVRSVDAVVLPGVGAFGPAVRSLRARALDSAIIERIETDGPLLAICLGMQLLFEGSDESPGVPGLGIVRGTVRRFSCGVRVPHMGWNTIGPTSGASVLRAGVMYFANSFRATSIPDGWRGATAEYAGSFAAAIERSNILACQFHPELSGSAGLELLERWLLRAAVPSALSGARAC